MNPADSLQSLVRRHRVRYASLQNGDESVELKAWIVKIESAVKLEN